MEKSVLTWPPVRWAASSVVTWTWSWGHMMNGDIPQIVTMYANYCVIAVMVSPIYIRRVTNHAQLIFNNTDRIFILVKPQCHVLAKFKLSCETWQNMSKRGTMWTGHFYFEDVQNLVAFPHNVATTWFNVLQRSKKNVNKTTLCCVSAVVSYDTLWYVCCVAAARHNEAQCGDSDATARHNRT